MRKASLILIAAVTTISIAVLILAVSHRENRNASAAINCPHDDGLRTYEQWRQGVSFPYAAPKAKLRRVRDNYNRIGVGSSKDEVIEAFGPPDFEEEMIPKAPNRPCMGYEFTYYFEKPAEMTNLLNDMAIQIFFTPRGKATWIIGKVGLAEKGSPAHRP